MAHLWCKFKFHQRKRTCACVLLSVPPEKGERERERERRSESKCVSASLQSYHPSATVYVCTLHGLVNSLSLSLSLSASLHPTFSWERRERESEGKRIYPHMACLCNLPETCWCCIHLQSCLCCFLPLLPFVCVCFTLSFLCHSPGAIPIRRSQFGGCNPEYI